MERIYKVIVNREGREKMFINLCNTKEQMRKMTVKQLKEKIFTMSPDYKEEKNLRLIFGEKQLEGDSTLLSNYGIQHMSIIQLAVGVPGGAGGPQAGRQLGEKSAISWLEQRNKEKKREAAAAAAATSSKTTEKIYKIVVHGLRGEKMFINLCRTQEQMKKMMLKQLKEKIFTMSPDYKGNKDLRLTFNGRQLEGDTTLLSDCGIQHMSVLHMVVRGPG